MKKYNNPFSVDHRKPVFMDSSDPRNKNLEQYRSRLGRDLAVTDEDSISNSPYQIDKIDRSNTGPGRKRRISDYWEKSLEYFFNSASSDSLIKYDKFFSIGYEYNEPYYSGYITKDDRKATRIVKKKLMNSDLVNGGFKPLSFIVLENEDIVVFGFITNNESTRPILIKFDSNVLQKIWEKEISVDSGNSPLDFSYTNGLNNIDDMYKCALDPIDNSIYITIVRRFPGTAPNFYDYAEFSDLIKLDKDANLVWKKRIWDTALTLQGRDKLHITDLKCDNNSNIYIYGSRDFYKGIGFIRGDVSFLIKIDSSGNVIYKKRYFTGNNTEIGGISFNISFIENEDYLYLGHYDRVGNGQTGGFFTSQYQGGEILKVTKSNGTLVSSKRHNQPFGFSIPTVSVTNNYIYLTVEEGGATQIYKFDKNLNLIYTKNIELDGVNLETDNVAIDSYEDIYISGNRAISQSILKIPSNNSKDGLNKEIDTEDYFLFIDNATSLLVNMNVFTEDDASTTVTDELDIISLNNTNNIIISELNYDDKIRYY